MHLTDIDIALFVEKKGSEETRSRVVAHFGNCAECAEKVSEAFRFIPELENSTGTPDPEFLQKARSIVPSSRRLIPRPVWWALAACVTLAFGILIISRLSRQPELEPSRFRSEAPVAVLEIVSPADGTVVTERNAEFRWQAINDAARYRFTLFREDGTVLWQTLLDSTRVSVPASVSLDSGVRYLWRVDALFAQRSPLQSAIHVFTIAN